MEHRWGRRISLDAAVCLSSRAGLIHGQLTNVSLSGAYVKTNTPVPPMSHTCLELQGSNNTATWPTKAWIVRVDQEGVGLEWWEFSPPLLDELLKGAMAHSVPHSEPWHFAEEPSTSSSLDTGPRSLTASLKPNEPLQSTPQGSRSGKRSIA